jgi:hypothetical protein
MTCQNRGQHANAGSALVEGRGKRIVTEFLSDGSEP